jgi:hypothetical protein
VREVLLERTAAYIQEFVSALTNVVAEEDYSQEFRRGDSDAGRQSSMTPMNGRLRYCSA